MRWIRTSYFPDISTKDGWVSSYLDFKEHHPKMHFGCYNDLVDNYWTLRDSNPEEARVLWWITPTMKKVMVYDFAQQFINEGLYVYEYKCSFDPTGNRLGSLHCICRKKPQSPRKRIIRVLGEKIWRFYFAHYDSKKYQEQMKKFKEGKLKSRPNGRKYCLLKDIRPRLGRIDPDKEIDSSNFY